jgi:hypothetical protein
MSANPTSLSGGMFPPALRRWYLFTAGLIAVVTSGYTAWVDAQGLMPDSSVFEIYNLIISLLIISWLVSDPQFSADKRPSFDHGMLLWMTFPVFALYQLFTTRRFRGMLILLGLFLLYAVPAIAVLITEVIIAL